RRMRKWRRGFAAKISSILSLIPRMNPQKPLTYRDAGVDIDVGDALVDDIAKIVRSTRRPEVLAGVGGFGALVSIPRKYKQPVLVSGTDGVGTKLRLGIQSGQV